MSEERLRALYAELEKTDPASEESKQIAEQILETIFTPEEPKAGSTVHEAGCPCGFCKAGFTKA